MLKKIIDVFEDYEDLRIDKFLAENLEDMSRSYIQSLIKDEKVLVNSSSCKAKYCVKCGDVIEIDIPELTEPEIVAENIPLDIVYEDSELIIVNKPKGMVVHPAAGHLSGTLVNALMYHCKDDLSGINGVLRPGIVHRIDMNTTGLLLVCKNDYSHNFIAEQLKEHSITRKYHAIVRGCLKNDEYTINKPIGRSKSDRKKMAVVTDGKHAVTHVKVLSRTDKFSYIECELETGRTHQIRVHMASLGYPILGDNIYGNNKDDLKLQGQTLHAKILGFIHPKTKAYMEFDSELPQYFKELISKYGLTFR
ncbi:MAG: RluA family pseudouridine synthase [Lachnospiraceae bacterium]|nr:RluA family pseudouridine synthase [Lachnospiraceae bacterium]